MLDQSHGYPVIPAEKFANGVLMTPDGRPVLAVSPYLESAPPADGRRLTAISYVLTDGPVKLAVSEYAAGTLVTPDGRPVYAVVLDDAAGADAVTNDPNFSSVKLLLGFNGADAGTVFTDESTAPVAFAVASGTPTTSTTNPKFGTAALRASSGWISTPAAGSPKWVPGASDWTVEFFACHDAANAAGGYFGTDTLKVSRLTATVLDFYWRDALGNNHEFQPTVAAVAANTYNHYCFERAGATTRCYLDGAMIAKGATGASGLQVPATPLTIGQNTDAAMVGRIDEFRFSHIARYNSDAGFAVPTSAYPRS